MSSGTPAQPVQESYRSGEASGNKLTDVKTAPTVAAATGEASSSLPQRPPRTARANREYQRREIELIMLVTHLLYNRGNITIDRRRASEDPSNTVAPARAQARRRGVRWPPKRQDELRADSSRCSAFSKRS